MFTCLYLGLKVDNLMYVRVFSAQLFSYASKLNWKVLFEVISVKQLKTNYQHHKVCKIHQTLCLSTVKSYNFMGTKFRGLTTMDMFVDT